jgi:AraC family transcriptional regulator, transcriptional activator of pobA
VQRRSKSIHTNTLPGGIREGIYLGKQSWDGKPNNTAVDRSHRDNGHVFILQEEGTTTIEIDFVVHILRAGTLIYINPSQVHRLIEFEDAAISSWIMTSENLRPEFLRLLEALMPANNLELDATAVKLIKESFSLCMQFFEKRYEKLFDSVLRESCNTLVALVISQYLALAATTDRNESAEVHTKAFKLLLEQEFKRIKSPADYAQALHISAPYLNECVKAKTGEPISSHIQQRVILEAKRLLLHTSSSVKEIAVILGYDDYSYFNRLFVKIAGMTPLAFRKLNCE